MLTRKIIRLPSAVKAEAEDARKATPAAGSTTTATEGPGPHHVRISRGEVARGVGTERIIGRPPGRP